VINDARCTREIKFSFAVAKVAFNNDDDNNKQTNKQQQQHSFLKQTVLKEGTSALLHLEHCLSMVLKLGYFGKQIRNTRKVLKCGAGK